MPYYTREEMICYNRHYHNYVWRSVDGLRDYMQCVDCFRVVHYKADNQGKPVAPKHSNENVIRRMNRG